MTPADAFAALSTAIAAALLAELSENQRDIYYQLRAAHASDAAALAIARRAYP